MFTHTPQSVDLTLDAILSHHFREAYEEKKTQMEAELLRKSRYLPLLTMSSLQHTIKHNETIISSPQIESVSVNKKSCLYSSAPLPILGSPVPCTYLSLAIDLCCAGVWSLGAEDLECANQQLTKNGT